ncbi:MAG: lipoyl(octanoyl) transferase LipB [Solirubrobacteraceae bacterium]
MTDLWVVTLGTIEYGEAYALQERVRAARQEDRIPDTLLLLEHPPVYTRGRRAAPGEMPADRAIPVVDVDRGGKLTYHGPGQLVGYPIMRTGDVIAFVRTMEQAIVTALAAAGVQARTRTDEGPDYTGVWVGDEKIASIGVHLSRGVTTHGFAVNVDNDLEPFERIIACGLPDVRMTNLQTESMPCFRKRMAHAFAQAHGQRQRLVSPARLEAAMAAVASVV